MEYTVIDIETMPNEEMIDKLPEPIVKYGNTKDEEKRKVIYGDAKQKQIDSMALNPMFGKIACIGTFVKEPYCILHDDEKSMIEMFIEGVLNFGGNNSPKIATWNGMGFDIPFVYKRALILGVKISPPMSFWMKRYNTTPHCDLMQVWGNWRDYEKLDTVANVLLGEGKIDFDVTTIKDLIKTDEGKNKISEYCKRDLEVTKKLFDKMNGILF